MLLLTYFAAKCLFCMANLSQSSVKTIKALHLKKFRQKYNNFIAEGDKIVTELLQQSKYSVLQVYALPEWLEAHAGLLQNSGVSFHEINDKSLKLISQLKTPNKVLAVVETPSPINQQSIQNNWSIFLDGLQDPGNVGTILRIADWFGIPNVIAGPGTVDLYNSKVLQASMGAFLRVQWSSMNHEELANLGQQINIYAADMNGENIFDIDIPDTGILAIGNEGRGLSPQLRAIQPSIVSILSPNGGGAESLNAGVATGIICAAIRR